MSGPKLEPMRYAFFPTITTLVAAASAAVPPTF